MSSFHLPFFTGTSTRSTFSFSIKSSSFPSSFSSSLVPFQRFDRFRSTSRTTTRSFSCVFYSLKAKAMAELVQDKESGAAATGSGGGVRPEVEHSRTFLEARSEQELLSGIRKEVEAGRLPPNVAAGMEELYQNYRNAVFQSGDPAAVGIVLSNMAVAFDRMLLDLRDPFVFETYHRALREPFDYYMFGQNYFRPLINFRNSYVGNLSLFYEIEEKLKQGHNVVLISNHQTEADPHIIALLLEKTNPHVAENMIYVAGDRVIADPLCKPFSMGRNLLCVHSKKHMFDVPELAEMKRRVNTRSLKEMALLLRGGSKIVWIAPSGGRDRPDPFTEEWYPAPFDSSSVDNMRRLIEHSGAAGHIYPLALLCYDIMPPPPQVEKEIGEKRIITFHGAGLSIAQKISLPEIAASCEKSEEAKDVYTQALYKSVTEQYDVLKSAVHGKQGLEASTAGQVFSLHKFLTHNKKAIRFVHKRMLCKKNPIFFLMPINDINGRLPFIGAESIRN
ncbi:glycerol-3-phosphate acyltransferase, chloroplastic-like isoform X2 [Durio zibethinus]|uniref:glycerol-3-phosphate 1-O-acyltransferase n=1 Tax=Durio zibethinus TaxID=66656 RepID=A0A6P5Y949_DURZI|nr:glycerol-3-phosphate acyltransferase, chloroplastic-like isoform X2 [Durio zibethinus]